MCSRTFMFLPYCMFWLLWNDHGAENGVTQPLRRMHCHAAAKTTKWCHSQTHKMHLKVQHGNATKTHVQVRTITDKILWSCRNRKHWLRTSVHSDKREVLQLIIHCCVKVKIEMNDKHENKQCWFFIKNFTAAVV